MAPLSPWEWQQLSEEKKEEQQRGLEHEQQLKEKTRKEEAKQSEWQQILDRKREKLDRQYQVEQEIINADEDQHLELQRLVEDGEQKRTKQKTPAEQSNQDNEEQSKLQQNVDPKGESSSESKADQSVHQEGKSELQQSQEKGEVSSKSNIEEGQTELQYKDDSKVPSKSMADEIAQEKGQSEQQQSIEKEQSLEKGQNPVKGQSEIEQANEKEVQQSQGKGQSNEDKLVDTLLSVLQKLEKKRYDVQEQIGDEKNPSEPKLEQSVKQDGQSDQNQSIEKGQSDQLRSTEKKQSLQQIEEKIAVKEQELKEKIALKEQRIKEKKAALKSMAEEILLKEGRPDQHQIIEKGQSSGLQEQELKEKIALKEQRIKEKKAALKSMAEDILLKEGRPDQHQIIEKGQSSEQQEHELKEKIALKEQRIKEKKAALKSMAEDILLKEGRPDQHQIIEKGQSSGLQQIEQKEGQLDQNQIIEKGQSEQQQTNENETPRKSMSEEIAQQETQPEQHQSLEKQSELQQIDEKKARLKSMAAEIAQLEGQIDQQQILDQDHPQVQVQQSEKGKVPSKSMAGQPGEKYEKHLSSFDKELASRKAASEEEDKKLHIKQEQFEDQLFHTEKKQKQDEEGQMQLQVAADPERQQALDHKQVGDGSEQQDKAQSDLQENDEENSTKSKAEQSDQEVEPKHQSEQRESVDKEEVPSNPKGGLRSSAKKRPILNLFDTKDSHPIIEYVPTKAESESASLTPSFVLEVKWPRVVLFYHPASRRCESLQPLYVALSRGIKRRSSRLPVEFHAVNCGLYRNVCEQAFDVRGVPTMMGLKSGRTEGIELTLPGSFDGTSLSAKAFAKDVEQKVEHIAMAMGVPLDAINEGHAGATFAQDADSALDEQKIAAEPESRKVHSIPVSGQVFHDARSSLLTTLTSSLYSQLPHGSALPQDASHALAEFLDLVRWAFPPETRVHDLTEDLRREYFRVSTSEGGLLEVVRKHMDLGEGITWSSRCGSEEATAGYSCGLWSLLHILSIGVAERHASVVGDPERITVKHASNVIRSFVKKFFVGCDSCREGWVELYDETCCGKHSTDTIRGGKAEEWKNLSVWIWKVHNEITIRRHQSDGKSYYRQQSRMASASSLWPSREDCPSCWQSLTDDTGEVMNMDSYDTEELYNYLKKIYWPSGVRNNRLIMLDRWSETKRALSFKRLRALMASHDLSTSVLLLQWLVAYLMIRMAFPRLSIKRMIWHCLPGRRNNHPKRHKTRAHLLRSRNNQARHESSPEFRSRQLDKNGSRSDEYYNAKIPGRHGGRRRHSRYDM